MNAPAHPRPAGPVVALARKLAVALWRYLELGLIPQGAIVKTQ